MVDRDKISIVIPTYNVGELLAACLDSVLHQTYGNFEVIIVNDGSTDDTGKICQDYVRQDPRLKYFVLKENRGLAYARNLGLSKATGDLIFFVDSDDELIGCDALEQLMRVKDANPKVPIVGCTFSKSKSPITSLKNNLMLNRRDLFKYYLMDNYGINFVLAKLYDARLWRDTKFPVGRLYEDVATLYKIYAQVDQTIICNFAGYYYRRRPGSIVRSPFSKAKLDLVYYDQEILGFICVNFPELVRTARSRLYRNAGDLLRDKPTGQDKRFLRRIRRHNLLPAVVSWLSGERAWRK